MKTMWFGKTAFLALCAAEKQYARPIGEPGFWPPPAGAKTAAK